MATVTATHILRFPHQVFFDPNKHFLTPPQVRELNAKVGRRVRLPAGTQLIPTEGALTGSPDRFTRLQAVVEPVVQEVVDTGETTGTEDKDPPKEEEKEPLPQINLGEARAAVDAALTAVNGDWDALTGPQAKELATGFGLLPSDIRGTGSGGNVLKADWITAVQGVHGA